MLPAELAKQEFAAKILASHKTRSKLAHTYLFTGGTPAVQRNLAEAFAVFLNETGAAGFGEKASVVAAKIKARNHPDVYWLGDDEKARSIKIEEIRNIGGWVSLKPYEGEWKVFIVCEAERLTVEAQNALLKTLEEPPAHTIFCLLAECKDNLLETIRSRSFEIRLCPEDTSSGREPLVPESFGQKKWEDFFEEYQSSARDELTSLIDSMMAHFRYMLEQSAKNGNTDGRPSIWIKTIDMLYETKAALQENANQKLALTRLTVMMKQLLPTAQLLKAE